ncbi:MAG: DUF1956 domain-containing protein [Rhizobiales bacterium]|nr:DUF1956 domain-containing protein [Hyphomicrobiales bacterium]
MSTKQRVLEAARTLFADRGFQSTTVRDIAMRAGTNVASINYHYRSKEELYRATLMHALTGSSDDTPSSAQSNHTATERLQSFIAKLLPEAGTESHEGERMRLLAWEMLSPTGILGAPGESEIAPYIAEAQEVVRPFLPEDASPGDDMLLALWLIGQCIIFRRIDVARLRAGHNEQSLVALVTGLALQGLGLH